jgi:hypothetical protein
MAFISLDSPSCEVPCLILLSVVNRDVTRQAKGLYRLNHVGALKSGLAYLSRCTSGWFCHTHDPPLPPLLAVHAHHAARVTPRPPRPLLLAVPLRACCPSTPSRRAARCCAGPSPSHPLALVACTLFPSILAAINGKAPVLPVTLPCRPSPLFLSAYNSDPKPPLTPPTPP